jgi:hypothetical protein
VYLTGMFRQKYFKEATIASLHAGIEHMRTKLFTKINSLCDKNAKTIMELTDDCSRHLREDVKTQFRKHLNTLSAATKAECAMHVLSARLQLPK